MTRHDFDMEADAEADSDLDAMLFDAPPSQDEALRRPYPVSGEPRSHQVRALNEADLKAGHCYFVDPGGGKTFLCIAEAGRLYRDGKIDGVLVVAPNGVHVQWIEQQFPRWCAVEAHLGHNQMTDRRCREFIEGCGPARLGVFAINYDAMHKTRGKRLVQQFMERNPRYMLIVDESHKVKNPVAKRTRQTMQWAIRAAYRRILSGTPILRGVEDLWSQYEICAPGLAWPHEPIRMRGANVSTYGFLGFRTHFCITRRLPNNPRAVIIEGYRNEDELKARVAPFVTRVRSSEFAVQDAPDIIPLHVPMADEQAMHYRQMKDRLVTQIDAGLVTAQNALVQMGKLLTIANGFLYHDHPEEGGWEVLSQAKIGAALDLVEQLDEPVLVWAPYRALKAMFEEEFRGRFGSSRDLYVYQPGTDVISEWEGSAAGVLLGNQSSSMGVGLNLQHAAANVYLSNTFSAEARWQSIKRTDRMGQTRQVRVWDLIAPGTLESTVMSALDRKEEISRANIDDLRGIL